MATAKAKSELPSVIQELRTWRKKNGLSQRGAAEVLEGLGYPVRKSSLQHWEVGFRRPGPLASKALEQFLLANPVIKDGPRYREKKPLPGTMVAEIRKLRATGWELEKIAERFAISGSAVSRICAGNRHRR